MKTRTAFVALLSMAGVLSDVASAQDRQGRDRQTTEGPSADRQEPAITLRTAPQRPTNPLNLPASPILPMINPIAPMTTAPVQPFIRYVGPEGRPTVVVPPTTNAPGPDRRRPNRNCCDIPVVVVDGPYLPYYPYYDPGLYAPLAAPAPIPGTLPGTYPVAPPPQTEVIEQRPPVPPAPTLPASIYYPEPNVIITPQAPPLVTEPPALGTSRTDAVARYGEPWGSVTMRGRETLYFHGGLEVVFENGKAVEVR